MKLEDFLQALQYDTNDIYPPDWEVDWEDAPLKYKLYRGLRMFPLSSEIPLTLEDNKSPREPDVRDIGHFLWYVFGLTQFHCSGARPVCRRYVPSGGALYPSELYVYLKLEDLPFGVYQYDVAHHRLVLLREGNFDSYLNRALGRHYDLSGCFAAVFVSTMFWKNFFKYHNFSYRLQGLDAGALIGQLLEVAKRFRYETTVCFQFLDRAVNHLLGLSSTEESVYAMIPMSVDPEATVYKDGFGADGSISANQLCNDVPGIQHNHYVRSQKIIEYPMLTWVNEASFIETTDAFKQIPGTTDNGEGLWVTLPDVERVSYDFAAVCRRRHSPEGNFVLGKVSQKQLSALLHQTMSSFSYRNDLNGNQLNSEPRVSLYCCLYNVLGIADGAYQYKNTLHALRTISQGDHGPLLQELMSFHNVNMFQVPLCFHVAGHRDHLLDSLGYRGYRIQQMEAGILVQQLLLSAFALGLGGHPLLDFNVRMCDEIYHMGAHEDTSLIQVPVGPYRLGSRLETSLHG